MFGYNIVSRNHLKYREFGDVKHLQTEGEEHEEKQEEDEEKTKKKTKTSRGVLKVLYLANGE
jgi:hypothetical protein